VFVQGEDGIRDDLVTGVQTCALPISRMFMTGSGGGSIAEQIGAKFVQEVTAVSLAVEKMHPEVYSVIELGGQDAKIIVFKDDERSEERRVGKARRSGGWR